MAKKNISKAPKTLTDKQQRFCEEYIIDWNGTRAAIAAGYSEKTAYSIGSENLRKPEIKDYIAECKNKIEELAGVSKLRAIKQLSRMAFADISEAYNDDGTLKPLSQMSEDLKATFEGVETMTIGEVSEVQKLKIASKRGAIQDLAKMLGWNEAEKIEHSGDINIEI